MPWPPSNGSVAARGGGLPRPAELSDHKAALLALADALVAAGRLDGPVVATLLGDYGVAAKVRAEGHLTLPPYRAGLDSTRRRD